MIRADETAPGGTHSPPTASRRRQPKLIDLATASAWIDAVGTPRLAQVLLHGMQDELPVAFCFVFLMPSAGSARLVSGASLHGNAALRAAESYLARGLDRFDINTRLLRAKRVRTRPATMLTLQTAGEITDLDYRRACYDEPGVHSRASIVVAVPGHGHAAVNFYRTLAMPPFSRGELRLLGDYSALLGTLISKHMQLLDRGSSEQRRQALAERLSARERGVIEGIVRGQTTKMIARELGLAATTVNTYRYRAFRRLGIRRENELFGLLEPGSSA